MKEKLTFGEKIADAVTGGMGSWRFIIIQTFIIAGWMAGNVYLLFHFDPFPFIFLNLTFSAQAAYASPLILMSQNRTEQRDRRAAEEDYATNRKAEQEIALLHAKVDKLLEEK